MFKIEDIDINLISYGPHTNIDGLDVGPDILIALESLGTFKGVTIRERLRELLDKNKDLGEVASRVHRESTRRGHASITTSLILQFEVSRCSRASTLLLAAAPFGSYLQESQRRKQIGKEDFIIPSTISGLDDLSKKYSKLIEHVWRAYTNLIDRGIPMEDARYILPLSSRTSIFVTGSLENFIWLIYSSKNRDEKYFPRELKKIGSLIEELALKISPKLTLARLSFKPLSFSYPYPDPYKPSDIVLEKIIERYGETDETILLKLNIPDFIEDHIEEILKVQDSARSLNPIIHAVTLEPLSIAAYHQSIRHRTVPTCVESIYSAMERAVKNLEKNIIIPPTIESKEENTEIFNEALSSLVETYSNLLDEGLDLSEAIYLCPQAVKIYTVRMYNAFNLFWPQGFIATRTCSYAQWEERKIAYSIWRGIEKEAPRIGKLMGEKCRHLRYCPEKNWCPIIKRYIPEYGDEQHLRSLD
ncbi:MAG: FAD-dependent thymidylate synthase [Aigarchaeota archaeon]|nr:FAD-dependent thymidylate synthase [Aigarchaeota archaeon]MCX8192443.1 FAD-dependent thymidylate synthase [Nitrososphaeria archaeon]MDW7986649.1 FAD-dependent thymidylate synthase [Nitrososphaerota archaeon]